MKSFKDFLKLYGIEVSTFVAGWCEKISVGCFLVAFFQSQKLLALTLGVAFFSLAIALKINAIKTEE